MHKVHHYVTIDSTNAEAHRLVAAGEGGPLWIVSDEQTRGRGRLGRTWVSKPGNLYATLILPCDAPSVVPPQLSFVVALAIRETAGQFVTTAVTLKWPNDCLLEGRKFSGVLIETVRPGVMALGMGLNVSHAPEGLPYKAAALNDYGCSASLNDIHQALDGALQNWLTVWDHGQGFAEIRRAWTNHCDHLSASIMVRLPEGELSGEFVGLAEDGAMLLKVGPNTRTIHAGDVVAH